VGKEIARGGMGAIFATKDLNIRRNIVTKVLHKKNSKPAVMRFIEEGQVNGQLEHPHIVPVYDLGINADDNIFFTMKWVKGQDFRKILEAIDKGDRALEAKHPLSARIDILLRICDAISYAHHKRVIHRDLKPENIMVGEFGEVLLMDWGLAKILDRPHDEVESLEDTVSSVRSTDESMNTIQGSISGTPQYMAPEQAEGKVDEMDEQTDVYSLGAILHSIVSLKAPFTGGNVHLILMKVVKGQGEPLSDKTPKELRAIIDKAMAVKKRNRYKTAQELSDDLLNYRHGYSVSAKRDSMMELFAKMVKRNKAVSVGVLIALIALMVGVAGIVWQWQKSVASEKRALEALSKYEGEKQKGLTAKGISAAEYLVKAKKSSSASNFDLAFKQVESAINFDSTYAPSYLFKAYLFIHKKEYKKAELVLDAYLKLNPSDKDSTKLLELCKQVQVKEDDYDIANSFYQILNKQEAGFAALNFAKSKDEKFKIYYAKVMKHFKVGLEKDKEGYLILSFNYGKENQNVKDISALKGIPLTSLILSKLPVNDISPLKGMTLTTLTLYWCPQVKDISALKGMPLTTLTLTNTPVKDISPLKGMSLERLNLIVMPVQDISSLKGMPLTTLNLDRTQVKDISPLKGMPLTSLNLGSTPVKDFSPLKGMPLTTLSLNRTQVKDISVLKGMPLTYLNLNLTQVKDISVLKGME